jgi:hypothetical protein
MNTLTTYTDCPMSSRTRGRRQRVRWNASSILSIRPSRLGRRCPMMACVPMMSDTPPTTCAPMTTAKMLVELLEVVRQPGRERCDRGRPRRRAPSSVSGDRNFAVTQVTRGIAASGHDGCVERPEPLRPGLHRSNLEDTQMDITWKPAVLALMGVVAIATVGLMSGAEGRGVVAHSAAVDVVDCNIRDPLSPCFDLRLGYPAGDLFVLEDSF